MPMRRCFGRCACVLACCAFAHAPLPRQGVKPDAAKLDAEMEAYMSAKPAATAKVAAAPAATDAAAAALAQAAL
jgi:hypothetical protein